MLTLAKSMNKKGIKNENKSPFWAEDEIALTRSSSSWDGIWAGTVTYSILYPSDSVRLSLFDMNSLFVKK